MQVSNYGRPGPVWIDIPLNVQSANIEPESLVGFEDNIEIKNATDIDLSTIVNKWKEAKKPLQIVGNGIRLSGGVDELHKLLEATNIPVITAVNGNDLVTSEYPQYYGRFGTHAQICANNLISDCDFLLTIGSRLYVRQTGYNFQGFAKQAYKVHVDVDVNELNKPTLFTDLKVESDAKQFLKQLLAQELPRTNTEWIDHCNEVNKAPKVLQRHRDNQDFISNYCFIEHLSKAIPTDHHVITSDGSANVVTMQVLDLKKDQRLITNTGCAPMGYGMPAAIGAAIKHKIVCLEGDGSLHLNVHELQTIKHYNLPIKLILLNNDGYLSIKISQKTFFKGKYVASEKSSGVSFPNFKKLINAYDLPYYSIKNNSDIESTLKEFFNQEGPAICEVFTDPNEFHEPKVVAKLGEDGKFIPGELNNIQWIE